LAITCYPARSVLDPVSAFGGDGGGGGGGGAKSSSNSGHLGGHQTIRLLAPPEDLPEFVNWIPSDEVLGEPDTDDTQEDEGVEAPRRTGLIAGIDLLDASDVALMADLGKLYWHDNPPMFWFSPRQVNRNQASQPQLGESVSEAPALGLAKVQQALGQLLQLLRCMGLTDAQVFFWSYRKSPSGAYDQIWSELIAAQGFTAQYDLLSGTAIAVDTLGVSLGMNNAKRSPLPGVLWRTLARLLAQMR
jgi:hypothetical protein